MNKFFISILSFGFILSFYPLTTFGIGEFVPSIEQKSQQVLQETAKTEIQDLDCPSGSQKHYDSQGKIDKCIVPMLSTNRDAKGALISVQCPQNSTPDYDSKGTPTGCITSPTKVIRGTDSSFSTKVAPRKTAGYNMYVKLPCQSGANCPSTGTPAGYIARLYQFGLMIAGLAAFGSIIYGSLLYVLSAGNIGSQQDARDQITQAILGLALLFGAYLILYTINPNLVSLANPAIEPLDLSGIETTGGGSGTGMNQNQNLDPLCKIGAKTGITMEGGSVSVSGPQGTKNLFEGGDFVCETCKANARKDGNGKCECDTGYAQIQIGSCERPEGVTAPGLLPETGDNLQYDTSKPGSAVLLPKNDDLQFK